MASKKRQSAFARARSRAARKGWETRRANARERAREDDADEDDEDGGGGDGAQFYGGLSFEEFIDAINDGAEFDGFDEYEGNADYADEEK